MALNNQTHDINTIDINTIDYECDEYNEFSTNIENSIDSQYIPDTQDIDDEDNYSDDFSKELAAKFNISIFAANIIQYIFERSWRSNKLIYYVIKADSISNFDFCSFMRGDYQVELKNHNIDNIDNIEIIDYINIIKDMW